MAREIVLRAAIVSDELTHAASAMILKSFGGYFRADGFGGYTFSNWTKYGRAEERAAVSWHIGTAAKDSERFEFVSAFAVAYCKAGRQESIYFQDLDGAVCLVFADGHFAPLV